MSINWTTLFDRIGKGIYAGNLCDEFSGAAGSGAIATDLPTEWEDFVEQYDGQSDALRATLGDPTAALYAAQNSLASMVSWVSGVLSRTIIVTTHANNRLASQDLKTALTELISQMVIDSKTVDANAVTATATAGGGNAGSGKLVLSVKDGAGKTLEYAYAETLVGTFTSTTRLSIVGTDPAASRLGYDWPKGSGASTSLSSTSATSGSNLVENGTFETFTVANTPDDWTIVVGAAGTDILSEASVIYTGSKSLEILGDGSTLSQIKQALDVTRLKSKTPYAINFYCRVSSNPAAGVLTVDLFDGTSVINDEAGTANSFTVDLTTLGTTFVAKNGAFRLPEPLPAAVQLRLRLSTAMSNTHSLFIDELCLVAMSQLYTGGPYGAVFDGAVAWSTDDTISVAVTNDYGGALQTAFWRYFDMPSLGLVLPSNAAGGENIADSVIA